MSTEEPCSFLRQAPKQYNLCTGKGRNDFSLSYFCNEFANVQAALTVFYSVYLLSEQCFTVVLAFFRVYFMTPPK